MLIRSDISLIVAAYGAYNEANYVLLHAVICSGNGKIAIKTQFRYHVWGSACAVQGLVQELQRHGSARSG